MIFFSVIIPTFNQAEYLKKAIESVLNQNFFNFEIIVIDNFSSDETSEVVRNFNSKKIRYKRFKNLGVIGSSRNEGIKMAKGNWIAFLDSDDTWYKNKLQKISESITRNCDVGVFCSSELILNEKKKLKKIWQYGPFKKSFYRQLLFKGNCISTSASVVKKSVIIDKKIFFNENKYYVTAEDYDFFLRIAFQKIKFKFIKEVLGEHLFHEKSMSSNYEVHKNSLSRVIKDHVNNFSNNSLMKNFFLFRCNFSIHVGDLKFFMYNKMYFKFVSKTLFLILVYPDRMIELITKKIHIIMITKKYFKNG
tara:strand:- start:4204 stop:5121 length:918 start_codon:yes stop_codon:yes gene_type:complete